MMKNIGLKKPNIKYNKLANDNILMTKNHFGGFIWVS